MSNDTRPLLSPVLKWAGGKRWLANKIAEAYWSYHKSVPEARFVEPFCGGLAVSLATRADNCLISDANPHLMNLYRYMQAGLEYDEDCGVPFENTEEIYYQNRAKFNSLCASREYWTKEGALLFYYLNRTCFNGLCRFNSNGYFNVPYGKYKKIEYRKNFFAYKDVLKDWELYYGDFATLPIHDIDFVYADPPYDVEFTQFVPADFTWEDQQRLAKCIAEHPGPALISNSNTQRIMELYKSYEFEIYELKAPRTISSDGDRTPADEILAYKKPK